MDWKNIFVSVIALAIIIRLIFIATGPMTLEDKVSKASNWLIGLVIISISWGLLNGIFGHAGTLFKGSGSNSTKPMIQIKSKESNNQSKEVKIKINTNEE